MLPSVNICYLLLPYYNCLTFCYHMLPVPSVSICYRLLASVSIATSVSIWQCYCLSTQCYHLLAYATICYQMLLSVTITICKHTVRSPSVASAIQCQITGHTLCMPHILSLVNTRSRPLVLRTVQGGDYYIQVIYSNVYITWHTCQSLVAVMWVCYCWGWEMLIGVGKLYEIIYIVQLGIRCNLSGIIRMQTSTTMKASY